MTRGSRWHSACRMRMLSRTSVDARLPCTNREVQSDLNDTEIGMALAQGGTHVSRCVLAPAQGDKQKLNETCTAWMTRANREV